MKVFEHLPNPLEITKQLYENMENEAYLIFDYIKSARKGLDIIEGFKEKAQVLTFIEQRFNIIKEKIDKQNNMKKTIVKKDVIISVF